MSRPPRASLALHIAKKSIVLLFTLLIAAVCGLILWRALFSAKIPKQLRELRPNEALARAFAEKDGALTAFTQEQGTTTRGEKNYGYFAVPQFVILPEAGQVQLIFRYNNSTLEATARDFSLEQVPPRGTEIYETSLVVLRDLTPQDKSDNVDGSESIGKTRIYPTAHEITTTTLYTYIYYTFDGVSLEDTIAIFFDVYYPSGATAQGAEPYGTLRIYHEQSECIPRELTKQEKAAIAAFGK